MSKRLNIVPCNKNQSDSCIDEDFCTAVMFTRNPAYVLLSTEVPYTDWLTARFDYLSIGRSMQNGFWTLRYVLRLLYRMYFLQNVLIDIRVYEIYAP
jgi:hypothetical protein